MIYLFKDEDTIYGLIEANEEGVMAYSGMDNLVRTYKDLHPDDYTYEEFIDFLNERKIKAEAVEYNEVEF